MAPLTKSGSGSAPPRPRSDDRLAARYPDAPVVVDDAGVAAASAPGRAGVSVAAPVFDDDVAEAIDALAHPVVELPSGARLSFHPTPALVAIDVDAAGRWPEPVGRAPARGAQPRTAAGVGRQIRLRNLSGGILVDLAGLPARSERPWGRLWWRPWQTTRAAALARVHRAGPGGDRPPAGASAAARVAGRAARGRPGGVARGRRRRAGGSQRACPPCARAPAVVSALRADPVALADLARRTGRSLYCDQTRRCRRRPGRWRRTMIVRKPKSRCPICGRAAPPSRRRGRFAARAAAEVDLGRWLTGHTAFRGRRRNWTKTRRRSPTDRPANAA